jgi:hypothetical protein
MSPEDELKLRFETFAFFANNSQNDDTERCKTGSLYFFNEKTSLSKTCEMILKMQKVMYRTLPPTSHEDHNKQFERMNQIVKDCKNLLVQIENQKSAL